MQHWVVVLLWCFVFPTALFFYIVVDVISYYAVAFYTHHGWMCTIRTHKTTHYSFLYIAWHMAPFVWNATQESHRVNWSIFFLCQYAIWLPILILRISKIFLFVCFSTKSNISMFGGKFFFFGLSPTAIWIEKVKEVCALHIFTTLLITMH